MKVIFICDWDYTFIWEKIVNDLKKEKIIKSAIAYVVGRNFNKYLDELNPNPFDKKYLFQDAIEDKNTSQNPLEVLNKIEKKYGYPNLNRYVWADRNLPYKDYSEGCDFMIKTFNLWEKIFNIEKPDAIAAVGYGSMPHLASHLIARKRKIPIFSPVNMRIGGWRYITSYDLSGLRTVENLKINFKSNKKSLLEIRKFIEDFRKNESRPLYEIEADKLHGIDFGNIYRFFY